MTVPNGYVPTPPAVADYVASSVFAAVRPSEVENGGRLLLPGLGTGNLYDAAVRYCTEGEGRRPCRSWDYPVPECVGVELDPDRVDEFHESHPDTDIEVHNTDFLLDPPEGEFDWVLANPPYTRYQEIDTDAREQYAEKFRLAEGQFPLYVPFFEQSMRLLKTGGWLLFIIPIQTFTVYDLEPMRWEIRSQYAAPIRYLPPQTFKPLRIETMMVGIKKQPPSERSATNLWLEQLRVHEVEELLEGLDVDDVEVGAEKYYEEHKITERLIKRRDNRERDVSFDESGKIVVGNDPPQQTGFSDF